MSIRYLDTKEEQAKLNNPEMSSNIIAESMPVIFSFYPT